MMPPGVAVHACPVAVQGVDTAQNTSFRKKVTDSPGNPESPSGLIKILQFKGNTPFLAFASRSTNGEAGK